MFFPSPGRTQQADDDNDEKRTIKVKSRSIPDTAESAKRGKGSEEEAGEEKRVHRWSSRLANNFFYLSPLHVVRASIVVVVAGLSFFLFFS